MRNKPKDVRAAILIEQNKPLIVDYIQLPDALFAGQILVELETSGICGSQLGEISGAKGNDPYLPHLLGHEGCAKVLDIGEGVSTVNIGDKVVLHWRKGEGIESKPPKYIWRDKQLNAGWVTTFNTHAIISENRCTKIPKDTHPELASLFGCAVTTGFGVVENNAKVKIGESIVVFGAGGIGLNIIQASSLSSAWPIIAVDLYDSRLELAKKFGATHIINSEKTNAKEEIQKIMGSNKLDIFIDNTGLPKIIELGYQILDPIGRLILVGVPRKNKNINIFTLPLHFGKVIMGSHGGESKPEIDIPRYLNLFNNGLWTIDGLISRRYNLEDINLAIADMKNGNSAGRILINL